MIEREKLAELKAGYCINMIEIDGCRYCITASEAHGGEVLLINTVTSRVQKIIGLAGGIMSIIPIPEENGAFLAIQRFYPIFDSEKAEVVLCRVVQTGDDKLNASVETVFSLPYVHRIALCGRNGERKIIAAALCGGKAFRDDWSNPGFVRCYYLNSSFKVSACTNLIDTIHKNHGMHIIPDGRTIISGEEGVWEIGISGDVKKLCDEAVSDLCEYDIDGDGINELVCISPFHGDTLILLKQTENGWIELCKEKINFGHVVFAGECNGPLIVSCSRAGDCAIKAWRLCYDYGAASLKLIESYPDVGATNICICETGKKTVFYSSDHGCDEIAKYTISL